MTRISERNKTVNTHLKEYELENQEITEDIGEGKGKQFGKCDSCKEEKYLIKCDFCNESGCRECTKLNETKENLIMKKKEIKGIRWNCKKNNKIKR